ncbi:MAG TPA: hypothetical protein VGJ05_08835 [Fimbriiglobus sp.]|jgi:hypothetical protein
MPDSDADDDDDGDDTDEGTGPGWLAFLSSLPSDAAYALGGDLSRLPPAAREKEVRRLETARRAAERAAEEHRIAEAERQAEAERLAVVERQKLAAEIVRLSGGATAAAKRGRPRKGAADLNARMTIVLAGQDDAAWDWSCRSWSIFLGCSPAAVFAQPSWRTIMSRRAGRAADRLARESAARPKRDGRRRDK